MLIQKFNRNYLNKGEKEPHYGFSVWQLLDVELTIQISLQERSDSSMWRLVESDAFLGKDVILKFARSKIDI